MKKIPLTRGKIALIDDEDYSKIIPYSWCMQNNKYVKTRLKTGKFIYLHRFIMECPNGFVVDHINGNTLDNRKKNLRICTTAENRRNNTVMRSDNKSGYKGVHLVKKSNKWKAQVTLDKKIVFRVLFHNKLDAVRAYNEAVKNIHKEFAVLNPI